MIASELKGQIIYQFYSFYDDTGMFILFGKVCTQNNEKKLKRVMISKRPTQ